jgi:sec-independent protein translocase protein TatC
MTAPPPITDVQFGSAIAATPINGAALALTICLLVGNLLALGYWARAEAAASDGSALRTFLMLASGYGLMYYVWVRYVRNDWNARSRPADRRERLVTAYSVAVLLAFVVGAVVTPPDPVTQIRTFPGLFCGVFILSALLVMRDSVGHTGDAPA